MPDAHRQDLVVAGFEHLVAEIFRKAGWRVRRQLRVGDEKADFVVDAGEKKYLIELKSASESRRDRLIPLLSQAILQAQALAQRLPEQVQPLAIVAAERIPLSVVEHLRMFAQRYAPSVGIGVIDLEGLRAFNGPGLEGLEAKPKQSIARGIDSPKRLPDLFTDLNQWMLKILLGQQLPDRLISVPRRQIRNGSQLAVAADVSVMSATRFLNQLENQGFLVRGDEQVRVVRVQDLLDMWVSANRQGATDFPARWVIKKGQDQLLQAL